jgi:AmiR/NasT family two-component response regulator
MSRYRFVQNFSQRRALVVTSDARACETLMSTLMKLGLAVHQCNADANNILALLPGLQATQDVLLIDGDLNCLQDLLANPGFAPPAVPVIGIVGVEAPSRLRALMQVGAAAFLPKPVHGSAVFSSLYLAVNEFEQKAALQRSIDALEERRRARRHVIRAVTLTMRADGIDDEAAFAQLRRESMRARMSLEDYCESFVRQEAGHQRDDASADGLPLAAGRAEEAQACDASLRDKDGTNGR